MHKKSILFSTLILFLIIGCSKDDEPAIPNYIGTFEANSLRDECQDPSLNASLDKEDLGVCLVVTDGQNCIDISITLNEDMTFVFTTRITEIRGGIMNSKAPATDTGTYEVTGNQLTLNPQSPVPTPMILVNDGTGIDWVVDMLSNGCDRIYGFSKT